MAKRDIPPKYQRCIDALNDLVRADNVNYQRRPMREAGLFDAGRVALAGVGIDRAGAVEQPEEPALVVAARALLERLDHITTEQFRCGGERDERETLRAVLERMTGEEATDHEKAWSAFHRRNNGYGDQ